MSIHLFKHNQQAYRAVTAMLEKEKMAAVIHPTGTGKSLIAFKLAEENPSKHFLWLSPSEYIYQTQLEKLNMKFPNIQFMSYSRLMKNEDSIETLHLDYIILDEFHRCGAQEWGRSVRKLLDTYPNAKRLGLSATNIRYLDNQRNMAEEIFDGKIASEMTLGEAIVREILPEPKYVIAMYSYQKELEQLKKRIRTLSNQGLITENQKLLEQLRRALEHADGLELVFKKHMTKKNGKYIVFCSDKEHMDEMKEQVSTWFRQVDPSPHVYTAFYSDAATGREFTAFKKDDSKHLKLLFCIDMLNEGIHVDDVDGVILLRPTVSPIIYLQQIGRALSAGSEKTPLIFDLVNNFDSLYCIDCLKKELEEAMVLFPTTYGKGPHFSGHFQIIDETKDCRMLFQKLQTNLSSAWETYYLAARQWYQENGNLRIPKSYVTSTGLTLGSWIQTQRRVYSGTVTGNLTEVKVRKLSEIGMMAFLSSYRQHEIYKILFNKIEVLSVDKFCKAIKKIQLAIFLENKQYLEENWKALISNLLFQEDYALAQSLLKDIYNLLENDFSASELFDALLMTAYCCLKLCDFHSDLLQVCFKELHDLSLITVISPEQIRLYHLLQAKHYLAVGQYLALIKQTDELRIIDPKLRHIRAIGIKHQYGINNCILSLKRGIKRFPENTLLKYSYYDHLLSISINKGDFKAAKANIDILKTYKEILSLEDQIHLEFNELTVLFYSKEMKDTRQLLGLCGKAYQNNLHVELSRSYNLLGQFFWTKKDWKKAIDAFDAAADLQDRTGHQTYRWIAKTNLALINLELRNNPDAVMYAKEIILGYYSSKRDKFKRIFTADNKMMYTDFFTDKEIVSILLMLRILYKNDYTGYTQIIETVKQPDIAVLPKEFEHFISRSFVSMLKKTYYYVDGNFMIKC